MPSSSARGLYAQVYLRRNFTIEDGAKSTLFQCAAFHLTRDGAKPQDGFLCVMSWNNKFVKLRLTTLSDASAENSARKYVNDWIPVLWGSGGASRAEQVRPAPRPQATRPPTRPAPRRFVCPPNYICESLP